VLAPTVSAVSFEDLPPIAIAVSPSTIELELKPDTAYDGTLKISNAGQQDFSFKLETSPLQFIDGIYTYDTVNEYTDLSDWITFDQSTYTLGATQSINVPYHINVPASAPGGGTYAAIAISVVSDPDAPNISITEQVVVHLLASVNGPLNKSAAILSTSAPSLLFAPPLTVTAKVENTGNVHLPINQKLTINNFFGDSLAYTAELSEANGNSQLYVLPGATRTLQMQWPDAPALGLFTIHYSITLNGQTETIDKLVLIIPIWLIILIIFAIALLITWLCAKKSNRNQRKSNQKTK
jgi:hypothetical protein